MIEIRCAHCVRVQLNATEVHDPREPGGIVNDNLLRFAAGRKEQRRGAQPLRSIRRCALLIKRLSFSTIDKALENDWTIANAGERARRDR